MNTGLSLSEFRSKISDLARPNRFEVEITPPSWMGEDFSMISWLVESAQIPSRTQGEISIKYHGMEYKLPGDYTKENLTIGFINSYGWEGKNFFDQWMEYIQETYNTNKRESSLNMLSSSMITVNQIGRTKSDILASYQFYDVFPTNISAIDLNMAEYDSVEKFTVSFAYSHFISLDVSGTNNG